MIVRFVLLTLLVAVLLGAVGYVLTTPEIRKQARYPAFLIGVALAITLGITFLEQHL